MPADDRLQLAREAYGAYESGDRSVLDELLSEDFRFYSPADVGSTARATSSAAGPTPPASRTTSSRACSRRARR